MDPDLKGQYSFMSNKNILIVSQGFYPEQSPRSFRATELTKEFCRQGHQVTVIAPYREGVENLIKNFPFTFKSLVKLNWKIFNFKKLGVFGRLYNKAVNRLLPLLFEYPNLQLFFRVKKALGKEQISYDLLISVAVPYPIHWGVAAVWNSRLNNVAKKWVADCGDPYCLQENDTFQPPFYFRWIEKWFMRKADYITVPTNNSFNGYFPEFHSKLRIVPQGFRFEEIEIRQVIQDGVVRFGYGGVFIPSKRDPREFLQFLTSLPKDYLFEFHIFTSCPQFVLPYIDYDKRIIVHEPVDRKELLETLSTYQFVVNFANQGVAQTPSKLIDYAIIDKPILNIETGNLDLKTIYAFLEGDYTKALTIMNIENYRIENVAQSFLKLA
jgi:hypothetical protein